MSEIEDMTNGDSSVPGEIGGDSDEWRSGRVCAEDGCENPIPADAHQARKYCDEHFKGHGGRTERRRKGRTGERAPKLVVDIGGKRPTGGSKDQRARDTAAGARAFLNVVAAGVAASGDNVCAAALVTGGEQWAEAVGELSKYQPWLSTFFAPVGGDSQLGAWLGFLLATGAIALPILAHHGMLPQGVGAKMAGTFVAAGATDEPQHSGVPGAA